MHMWTNISVFTALVLIIFISLSNSHPTKPSEECEPELNHPELWKKVVEKGRELQKQMNANSQRADQTSFTRYSDLEKYGWTEQTLEMSEVEGSDNSFLKSLGIDHSNSEYISLDQDTEKTVDNIKYGKTGGFYRSIYSPQNGALVAVNNVNPKLTGRVHYAKIKGNPMNIVPLNRWSDVVFLEWQKLCEKVHVPLNSLKHIIRYNVDNGPTEDVIQDVFGLNTKDWSEISHGRTFYPGEEEFTALLGTPNGSGVAYMLIDHKGQFGQVRVKSITVKGMKIGGEWFPWMVQKIETFG